MTDKKKTIKIIALVLISILFLFMFYNTFFKTKKNSVRRSVKNQPPKVDVIVPGNTISRQTNGVTLPIPETGPGNRPHVSVQPFRPVIPNIFEVMPGVEKAPKKDTQISKPISEAVKTLVKILEPQVLTEQEKMNISHELQFNGSILSGKNAVAIINDEFIHVGDTVNGYKVASISEQQVFIDTGRGTIILEIMPNE